MDSLFPPMETAVSDGNTALFIQLLNQPEHRSKLSTTMVGHDCLTSAIMLGRVEIVRALVTLPVEVFDWAQEVPLAKHGAIPYLSRAAHFKQFEIFKIMVETGKANINERDSRGYTALHYACNAGCLLIVDFLLQQEGVNPNERDLKGQTPLHFTAMEGSLGVTRRLLRVNGLDPDVQDHEGRSPYYWTVVCGNDAVGRMLVDSGRVNRDMLYRALDDLQRS